MSNNSQNRHKLKLITMMLVLGMALSACGNSTPARPVDNTPTNEYHNMKWDQSTWG